MQMKKKLVLAGAGHAHMVALANLHEFVGKGYHVTVIGPSDYHYYSGMGPGMLGRTYKPEEIRFSSKRVVEQKGGVFLRASVEKIDAESRRVFLDSGDSLPYDVMSCNLGSHVPLDMLENGLEDIYPVKPIERLLHARQRILDLGSKKQISIGIIGGGPSSLEIAGNLWRLTRSPGIKPAHIKILSKHRMLPRHPDGVRERALISLKRRGIEILNNCDVLTVKTGSIKEASGKIHNLDIIVVAVGVRPNPVFKNSGIPTGPDGGLRVNRYLQSTVYNTIFGGGDCIYFEDAPLEKVGVYAVRQNPVIYHNLMAALEGRELKPFDPGGDYLLIFNLGDGTGIFHKWRVSFNGRLAFRIKDRIDRKFMQKYQSIE